MPKKTSCLSSAMAALLACALLATGLPPVAAQGPGSKTRVGTGRSSSADPAKAAAEAVAEALRGGGGKTDFAILLANSGGAYLEAALKEVSRLLGGGTPVYGGTSDSRGLLTDKGFIYGTTTIGYGFEPPGPEKALALMTVSSRDILFGTGYAEFSAAVTPREGTRRALLMAVKNANQPAKRRPRAALITPSYSDEEAVLGAMKDFFGAEVPVVGGTAGGPVFGIIGGGRVFVRGVSVALIYTDLPVGMISETGFKPRDIKSGIITSLEVDGSKTIIRGIDNRPAWTVYNEWLKNGPENVLKERGNLGAVTDYTALNPLFRQLSGPAGQIYYIYNHPLVDQATLKDKAFYVYARFRRGDRIQLTSGSWESVLNTIWSAPSLARNRAGITKPVFSFGYICAGLLGSIPEAEREKVHPLMLEAARGAPFLSGFAWGEEGMYPGIGNRHVNQTVTFITIGEK